MPECIIIITPFCSYIECKSPTMNVLLRTCFLMLLLFFVACKTDKPTLDKDLTVKIRLKADPQKLSPMVYPTSTAREVFQYIFLPLADYDPVSLELTPILVEKVPEGVTIEEGPHKGGIQFDFQLLKDAKWSDGKDITAKDYHFTVKAVNHPEVNASGWRAYIKEIKEVILYENDPKKFSVVMSKDYMVAKETVSTINMYPSHIYDEMDVLNGLKIADLKDKAKVQELADSDTLFSAFAKAFNSQKFTNEIVVGNGPYKLGQWETNQYVVLDRVENYWGENYSENPFLNAHPKSIEFQIIPDETSALSLLKSQEIDFMPSVGSSNFSSLKGDEKAMEMFSFLNAELIRYYYIGLNNRNPNLSEKSVRQALAHLVDVDRIIETLELGMGTRTIGHFNPVRSYYNNDLKPIPYLPEKAAELMDNAGWKDSNNNGIRDKVIDGNLEELDFKILVSSSKLGQKVSLMFKESAKAVGVNIELVQKEFKRIRQDHLKKRDFDMACLVATSDLAPIDPYDKWHTDNMAVGKRNDFGFGDQNSDDVILALRSEKDQTKRKDLYHKLQEIMYDEQPVIFLYCPTEKMILNKKFKAVVSARRPGYMANSFVPLSVESFSEN